MDPQNNQPQQPLQPPQGQAPGQPQNAIPPQQGADPDWQQGLSTLGASAPAQDTQPGVVAPGQPVATTVQPQMPQQNGQQPVQPVVGQFEQPSQNWQPTMGGNSPAPKKKPVLLFVIIAAVVVLALGAGVFFWMGKSPKSNSNANKVAQESTKSVGSNVKDLSKVSDVTFAPPSDMSAYEAPQAVAGATAYTLKNGTSTNYCKLTFGTFSAADVPGNDINEIVNKALDKLKPLGITISGPTAGAPLVLKDESGKASYSMATLNFSETKESVQETDHSSIVVMSSGKRAEVVRTCVNIDGAISQSGLDTLDATAKSLTVKVQ